MFIFARDAEAVRLIAVQGGQQLGWDCDQEQQIDLLVKAIKAELDRTAIAMKEALREGSNG